MKLGNVMVGQSGGPTSAINATLSGVIRGCAKAHEDGIIGKIFGMRNGIDGFLEERLVDLSDKLFDEEWLSLLESTPSAALGSCRRKLKSFEQDSDTYKKNARYFQRIRYKICFLHWR